MRHVLRSIGVIANKLEKLRGNNTSVCNYVTTEEGLCKKRHATITFHKLRDESAAGAIQPYNVSSIENMIDFLTRALGRDKRNKVTNRILR